MKDTMEDIVEILFLKKEAESQIFALRRIWDMIGKRILVFI